MMLQLQKLLAVCAHGSLIEVVGDARLEMELGEFSRSTDSEIVLHSPFDTMVNVRTTYS